MIDKQQALEFIYDLYNQTTVYINLEKGKMYADVYVDYEEGITGTYTADIGFKPQSNKGNLLEELVTEFIKSLVAQQEKNPPVMRETWV